MIEFRKKDLSYHAILTPTQKRVRLICALNLERCPLNAV